MPSIHGFLSFVTGIKKCDSNATGGGGTRSILFQHGHAAGPPATLSVGEGDFFKVTPSEGSV